MLIRRLVRDESGITMGITVFAVVLIGVMGAGLLTFVHRDLEAVVEENHGQRAFYAADAGAQAARRQLLLDADPARYDDDLAGNSEWASTGGGKALNLGDDTARVTIRYLPPSTTDAHLADPDRAPEPVPDGQNAYPGGKAFFKVASEGRTGRVVRKVEVIYETVDLDVPKSYYTPNSIELKGTADVRNVSLFTLGDVTVAGGARVSGTDPTYGDWQSPVNPTARPTTAAGIGAAGTISSKVSGRDFDAITTPAFDATGADSAAEITFPFDHQRQPDITVLRERAKQDGTYVVPTGTSYSLDSWPADSSDTTVVFVEFAAGGLGSRNVSWNVPGTCTDDPPKRGVLVVNNGNFTTQPNEALFSGVVIVRGGEYADGSSEDTGRTCLDGFVNADGVIKIAGTVTPTVSDAAVNRPGFYDVRVWSWRECYSLGCT